MNVDRRSLDRSSLVGQQVLQSIDDYTRAYRQAVDASDTGSVDEITRRWAEVRATIADVLPDGSEYKTIYGNEDVYPTWRYARIVQDSTAVVALGEPGRDKSFCSGVLISDDLVLTAGHCFSGPPKREPAQVEVWLGYAEQADGNVIKPWMRRKVLEVPFAPAVSKWPDLLEGRFDMNLLDYAIVRIKPPADGPAIPSNVAPQCLKREPPHRNDALYVVGYPKGLPIAVHDNARVELPYRVAKGREFDLLRLQVETDFRDQPEREAVLSEFDRSYVLAPGALLQYYYFHDVRDGGQARMGISADTSRGNSGGPVFDHNNRQCVVGILNRGMPDTPARLQPNWMRHERVLPIRAILDDLAKVPSTAVLLTDGKLDIEQ
jgi:hypothetical protein